MFFCYFIYYHNVKINLFKRDCDQKELQTQYSIIKNYDMNEHTLYSGLPSDPWEEVLKWKYPFTCIVGGPSDSGKTSFVIKLIKHAEVMFTEIPQSISWHYGEFQQWMLNPEYSTINLIEGMSGMTSLDPTKVNLLIIDNLMHEMNEVGAKLFTKGSHNRNTGVHQKKHSRTVSLNAHYMVLFKDVRDASLISKLSQQIYPGDVKYLRSRYEDATNKHYGYLLIDI